MTNIDFLKAKNHKRKNKIVFKLSNIAFTFFVHLTLLRKSECCVKLTM